MGFLDDLGQTLKFVDSVQYQQKLKEDAIIQFLNLSKKYHTYTYSDMHKKLSPITSQDDLNSSCSNSDSEDNTKNIKHSKKTNNTDSNNNSQSYLTNRRVYWGDEIESHLIVLDHENKRVYVQPNQKKFRDNLKTAQVELPFQIHEEYGAWMIETVPQKAYPTVCRFGDLIENIRSRSSTLKQYLGANEYSLMVPSFPLLGTKDFHMPFTDSLDKTEGFVNKVTNSKFIDDRLINPHPRFPTLTENIRNRRGENVNIQVPLFIDENTKTEVTDEEPYKNMIYMDAMAFGMGSCCLQTTFSAIDFPHARWLYDQLSILSPIFLALTAGSSIFKGKLADIDTRWDIIAASVDDRNSEERSKQSGKFIPKSRYDSISMFISDDERNLEEYNDYDFPINEELMAYGKAESEKIGIKFDEKYWKHIGFLFMRDALVIFKDDIKQQNDKNSAHFENIQTTNWNSVRLKLPPSFNSAIGWRVEFRTTEVQLTDDENAAISMLVHVLVRMLYEKDWFKLNLYIPMSLSQKNFERSRKKGAILTEKFYFRTNLQEDGPPQVEELTVNEIFFGKQSIKFQGLYALYIQCISQWNQYSNCQSFCCRAHVDKVFEFVRQKCTGQLKTLATWQREFIINHKDYKKDSVVSQEMGYDLCKKMIDIQHGYVDDENFPQIFPKEIFNKQSSQPTEKYNAQEIEQLKKMQQQFQSDCNTSKFQQQQTENSRESDSISTESQQ